ncbi:hypothetical protein [Mycobacterium seoulense]
MGDRSATTTSALAKALGGYEIVKNKEDRCTKVTLNPSLSMWKGKLPWQMN